MKYPRNSTPGGKIQITLLWSHNSISSLYELAYMIMFKIKSGAMVTLRSMPVGLPLLIKGHKRPFLRAINRY